MNDTARRRRSSTRIEATAADPLHQLLAAMHAVRDGDFSVQLPLHWDGLAGKLADSLQRDRQPQPAPRRTTWRASAQKVGREGQTRQRMPPANRQGAMGGHGASVNDLIDDLVRPIETMTEAMAGVAKGDLTRTVPLEADGRPLQGEFLRSANIVNRMIEQMGEFSSEVTRVALRGRHRRPARRPGQGQGRVRRVEGPDRLGQPDGVQPHRAGAQHRRGDHRGGQRRPSRKITVDVRGEILQLKEAINTMVDQLRGFASEVTRVAREVGTEGKLGGQAIVPGVAGTWKDLTDSVNAMASNLTSQVRNIAEVTTAVAKGDLVAQDHRGRARRDPRAQEHHQHDGRPAQRLRRGSDARGARGRHRGKLGGQAQVPGVAGTWKDLTDYVNSMASNLTSQVRNIAEVTTAVAKGDLRARSPWTCAARSCELKDTINTMVDQLNGFAAEVTRVAREVGTEGKLGGQAQVPGVAGTWKDLTDNVNSMASNLTTQVRNIAEVDHRGGEGRPIAQDRGRREGRDPAS